LVELVDVLPPGEELGNAMACIAQSAMLRDKPQEAIEWADRAIAMADELDLPSVRVWAQCEKGSALLMVPERIKEGILLLERSGDDAEVIGEYVVVARALNNRVRTGPYRPDPDEARAILARMRRAAERAGFDTLSGQGYWEGLASLAEWDGDLDGAIGLLEEGRGRLRKTLSTRSTWYTTHEAGLALEAGALDKAAELFDDLRPGVGALATSWYGLAVHIACRRGDLTEARRFLPELISLVAVAGAEGQLLHDVTSALLAAGATVDEVRPLVSPGQLDEKHSKGSASAWPSLLSGQVLEAAGQYEDALTAYQDAGMRGEEMLGNAPTGTALVGVARCLIALGRADETREYA